MALGADAKAGSRACVQISVDEGKSKHALGTLASGHVDQFTLDLVLDRNFLISHTGAQKGGAGKFNPRTPPAGALDPAAHDLCSCKLIN